MRSVHAESFARVDSSCGVQRDGARAHAGARASRRSPRGLRTAAGGGTLGAGALPLAVPQGLQGHARTGRAEELFSIEIP